MNKLSQITPEFDKLCISYQKVKYMERSNMGTYEKVHLSLRQLRQDRDFQYWADDKGLFVAPFKKEDEQEVYWEYVPES